MCIRDSIHTENSYKYGGARFAQLAAAAGWEEIGKWMGTGNDFGVHLLRSAAP